MMILVIILWSCLIVCSHCANIVAFMVTHSTSHFNVIEPLLQALARRGHNLTVVTSFPKPIPLPNYNEIIVNYDMKVFQNSLKFQEIDEFKDPITNMQFILEFGMNLCDSKLKTKELQDLYNKINNYDLVISHLFSYECFNAFAYKFNVPLVSIVTSTALPWTYERIGNPDHPAYIINNFIKTNGIMNLYQRISNTLMWLYANVAIDVMFHRRTTSIIRKHLNISLPKIQDINKKTSLVMVNTHFSMFQSIPAVPNFIEIGGIHIEPPKRLPKDLQEFLDLSPQGAILFSLGSLIRTSSMPDSILRALMEAFSELPQRVVFKFEEPLQDAPPNVLVRKWIPQRDLLDHPNVRVIMSHGGQSSTIEAVNAGVPIVGMPLYSDQHSNIECLALKGSAILLQLQGLNKDKVLKVLNEVLNNTSYQDNAAKIARQFQDRPLSPLDTAVYWTEYVLRHKGAPHLRCRSADIPAYQYYFLDVISVSVICIALVVHIVQLTLNIILHVVKIALHFVYIKCKLNIIAIFT